jgi:hypothetical protein
MGDLTSVQEERDGHLVPAALGYPGVNRLRPRHAMVLPGGSWESIQPAYWIKLAAKPNTTITPPIARHGSDTMSWPTSRQSEERGASQEGVQ